MSNNTYNGWSNKETWNINMVYGEIFTDMCDSQTFDDVDHLAGAFESIVVDLEYEGVKSNSLADLALSAYLHQVDWNELAEHWAKDHDMFQESAEEETEDTCMEL